MRNFIELSNTPPLARERARRERRVVMADEKRAFAMREDFLASERLQQLALRVLVAQRPAPLLLVFLPQRAAALLARRGLRPGLTIALQRRAIGDQSAALFEAEP